MKICMFVLKIITTEQQICILLSCRSNKHRAGGGGLKGKGPLEEHTKLQWGWAVLNGWTNNSFF